ncbi:DNA cytosine methyltransferase [Paenibacillus cucumis (ex Kampfer et al. 2016)]|uniref:DNA (cytosine-5-)-methyltransferase n=1 Tax=Paenibacillus cucumis (ex Kampfer et al. 2016) TaxID=1776858 RepID=A0ABS7KL56_9BACL|nr:DNA cytosine methyltransferase [Paenibacillus cucumis (ex Kampfer et al. 2016)]MBY0204672.1 DNA cytosine methyltransferase [Paenibacillus cucumis (ex Kampfer et al. 2016)]
MNKAPVIFSFFSGAGFLDLGFEESGYNIAFVNEYHRPFLETYIHSRQVMGIPEPRYGYHLCDITEFEDKKKSDSLSLLIQETKKEGNLVGFIGGPPCPDFSVGGKNKGHEGENGKLTATYIDLICKQSPDFFLFENVKGLWRTKKHRAFYDLMKERLQDKEYVMTERLINSIEYGAPQQRERIILIGFKKNVLENLGIKLDSSRSLNDTFPWEEHIKYRMENINEVNWPGMETFEENIERTKPENIIEDVTVNYWFKRNDVERHPNSNQFFTPRAGLTKFLVIPEGDDSKKSYKRLHRWRPSPTAAYGNNEVHLHPYKARRLSVAEALALQSLPKEYELPQDITLSNAFKTVGNGVPFLASKGIAETILDFLELDKNG